MASLPLTAISPSAQKDQQNIAGDRNFGMPAKRQPPHRMTGAAAPRHDVEVAHRAAGEDRVGLDIGGEGKRLAGLVERHRNGPADGQPDSVALDDGKRAVDAGKQRERPAAFHPRHGNAPVEAIEARAGRKDGDLGRGAAAVLPRHFAVAAGAKQAHGGQPRMPGRLSPCSLAQSMAMS